MVGVVFTLNTFETDILQHLNLNELSPQNLNELLLNKALSKFGDALVNFTYSLAKSIVLQMPTGEKVPDKTLGNALRATALRKRLPSRVKIGTLGDVVEAFLAYMWLTGKLPLQLIVKILVDSLRYEDLSDRKKERRAARDAYISLLETTIKILENSPIQFAEHKQTNNDE
jgi:phosphatidylserine/phosphatidylglycerophosphate/cardiolipin synthase-like enzyme